MVEPLRHRQTKGAATDTFGLQPPRHISTLHSRKVQAHNDYFCNRIYCGLNFEFLA